MHIPSIEHYIIRNSYGLVILDLNSNLSLIMGIYHNQPQIGHNKNVRTTSLLMRMFQADNHVYNYLVGIR